MAPRRFNLNRSSPSFPEPTVPGDNCLNLNVFTPDLGASALPVLVWIHGGGFFAGCSASPWYRGDRFARDGVVLVSINYRLGIEGFLAVEDGGVNRGVLDWLAALEWVQQNIGAFGGDPTKVTVAGQSAGGMAAAVLLSMPRARTFLRRAICMSGPVAQVGTAEQAQETARTAAKDLGIRLTRHALSGVPIERLLEAQARLMPFGPGATPDLQAFGTGSRAMLPLAPCVDGDIVPLDPLGAVRGGAGASKDLLAGTTTEEFNMVFALLGGDIDDAAADQALQLAGLSAEGALAYRKSRPGSTGANIVGQAMTDRMFRVPTEELCDAQAGADGQAFLYQSAWRSPGMGGLLGAAHCVDVPFAFDNLDASGVEVALGSEPPRRWRTGCIEPGWTSSPTVMRGGPPSSSRHGPPWSSTVRAQWWTTLFVFRAPCGEQSEWTGDGSPSRPDDVALPFFGGVSGGRRLSSSSERPPLSSRLRLPPSLW